MFASRAECSWDDRAATRRCLRWLAALAGVLLLVAICTSAQAQTRPQDKRIALVIGNGQYPKAPLGNPENDARVIAANLRRLGFEVNEQLNLPVLQFRRVLRDFAKQVQQDDAIAVLYYAGHGLQIDGRNYLLPVDINLRDQEEVKDESVDVDELFLSRIDKVGSFPRIVILDACRNNPFASKTRNIRSSGGLAEMGARGTLIAFASAPGAAAEDGPDGGNSVYTKSLAEEMMVPGVEVEQMFKNVRVKVLRDTAGRQLPWVNTSLTSNFSFNPAGGRASATLAGRATQNARPQGSLPTGKQAAPALAASSEPAVVAAPASSAPVDDKASRAKEPKDIESALALARREQSAEPAVAPPAAEKSGATAAPATTQLAMQTPAASISPTPASSPPTRKQLDREEVQQLLVGKSHTIKEAVDQNGSMRWDLRAGGRLYYNSQSSGRSGVNGSGRWELKSDGSLCVAFTTPPPMQPSDARRPDSGCWYFYREGDRLVRVSAGLPTGTGQAEVVKIP